LIESQQRISTHASNAQALHASILSANASMVVANASMVVANASMFEQMASAENNLSDRLLRLEKDQHQKNNVEREMITYLCVYILLGSAKERR
jgi:hypothetical protein